MKLEGSFEVFPLRELIEMTVYSSVTGVLNIYSAQGDGQIFFRDGQPYHATFHTAVTGMAAVVALFERDNATFAFVADVGVDAETLFHDPLDMVEQAERSAMRWKRLRPHVPDLTVVPYLICAPDRARYNISPAHWSIFTAIDGQRSLETIIQMLNLEPIEVCEALVQMKLDQLIDFRRSQRVMPTIAPEPAAVAAPRRAAGVGIFDRLMANVPPLAAIPAEPTAARKGDAAPARTPAPAHALQSPEEDRILRLLRS